ncbi:OmpH family outer membrane protein [Thalassoglobus polymorphus]|uniref:Outer membrane protein (OmpH-like) n=1 Tax=Thalassoglobus polymorphus TaxID=2527994 RepID=A0A517QL44_9PLAN|nr:OmpH family outer membrane protein [Thalassoglobus polymorphus]QDT32331.1 Outer membrane protein (OmpH-like) [Thalassoglobus polymorphus]
MNRSSMLTACALVAAFGIGLTWSYFTNQQSGGVAIVDLDEVARRIGRDKEMVDSIQTQAGALNKTLVAAQQSAVNQLNKAKSTANEDEQITNEEAQQFVRMQRNAQVQLTQLQQKARLNLNQHRQGLVSQFRKDAQPIAAKVAKERGFDSVVTRNDTVVFSYDKTVDITEDVIKQMSAEMPAKPAKASTAKAAPKPAATAKAPESTTTN